MLDVLTDEEKVADAEARLAPREIHLADALEALPTLAVLLPALDGEVFFRDGEPCVLSHDARDMYRLLALRKRKK